MVKMTIESLKNTFLFNPPIVELHFQSQKLQKSIKLDEPKYFFTLLASVHRARVKIGISEIHASSMRWPKSE
jgi:hypothetical protein